MTDTWWATTSCSSRAILHPVQGDGLRGADLALALQLGRALLEHGALGGGAPARVAEVVGAAEVEHVQQHLQISMATSGENSPATTSAFAACSIACAVHRR